MLADDFVGSPALHPLGASVPTDDLAFRVEHGNGIVLDAIDQQSKSLLALQELLLQLRACAEVLAQCAICLLQLARACLHARRELIASLAEFLQGAAALADRRPKH